MKNPKISFAGVLQEGVGIGLKNAASLIGAVVLWLLTCWIPYINVGTTIAINSIPLELSRGKVLSPTFIFDAKYRQYMGEYFTLIGLMSMSLIPAFCFMIIPGIIIAIGWSLALYIMLDQKVAPGEALVRSNKATNGYKMTIFGVLLVITLAFYLLFLLFAQLDTIGFLLIIVLYIAYIVAALGCMSVFYRELVVNRESSEPQAEPADTIE